MTWKKYSARHKDYDLRGCIGYLSPIPLSKLKQYALTRFVCRVCPDGCDKCALKQPFLMWRSALKDHRFPPMQPEEMKHLHCGVSLLVNYEEGKAWNDFEVGFGHCPLCYASALTYGGAMQIGKHGIIIEFGFTNGDHYNATYLPEVAKEQGTAGTVGHCLLHP